MEICLSHTSLMQALSCGASLYDSGIIGRSARVNQVPFPDSFSPEISQEECVALCEALGLSLPIHTLCSDASLRKKNLALSCHVWDGGLFGSSVYRVSDGLYVSSPEMLFLQMASEYDVQQLIRLGFDLCGTYRRAEQTAFNCNPLTSVNKLQSFLSHFENKKGLRTARRALTYVRDGSFSPKETDLAMKLGLPSALGGEGLGMPLMNYRIELSDEASRMVGQSYCLCDLYWPDRKVDVEFNGYATHHGNERNTHDRKRELALRCMGIDVITAVNDQVLRNDQFDLFARQVAKATGKCIRHRSARYNEMRFRLDRLIRSN